MESEYSPEVAYSAIFEQHYKAINAYTMRRVFSKQNVDDVVSEVFLVAWRRWDEVSGIDNPLPWLYRVAGNLIRNSHRSDNRRSRLVGKMSSQPEQVFEDPALRGESGLVEALSELSDEEQEILMLVAWEGLSHSEVAEVLDCSANAVGIRVHRAKKSLQEVMDVQKNLENIENSEREDAVVDINGNKTQISSNLERKNT